MIYQVECNDHHVARYDSYEEAVARIPGVKDGKGNWVAPNPREMDGTDVWCITVDGYRMLPRNLALKYFLHHKYAGLSCTEAMAKVPQAILLSLTPADHAFMSTHGCQSGFDVAHACANGYVFGERGSAPPHNIDGHYLEHSLTAEAHEALECLRRRGYAASNLAVIEKALVDMAARP